MTETRQQRRHRERALAKIGEAVLRRGLPTNASPSELSGLTFALSQSLSDRRAFSPATDCARLAHKSYEASVRTDPPKAAIACSKGCAYCCYATVMVTAPEAFLLAREVGQAKRDEFASRVASTANQNPTQRFGKKLPCPFLMDGACSAYQSRPLACRRVTSFSLAPCIEEYEGKDGDILLPQKLVTHAQNSQVALLSALRAAGHPAKLYELSAAVLTILNTDRAESRWLAGEDIFTGVLSEDETIPVIAARIEMLAAALA